MASQVDMGVCRVFCVSGEKFWVPGFRQILGGCGLQFRIDSLRKILRSVIPLVLYGVLGTVCYCRYCSITVLLSYFFVSFEVIKIKSLEGV